MATPKDRDQLTPAEDEDKNFLETHRGQGTGGSGIDQLAGDKTAPGAEADADDV